MSKGSGEKGQMKPQQALIIGFRQKVKFIKEFPTQAPQYHAIKAWTVNSLGQLRPQ